MTDPSLFSGLRQDVAVPRWLVYSAIPLIAYHAILGLHLIVTWLS